LVDLISEGFDMTLRGHVGPLKDSTLRQRVVARTVWALTASPDWLAKHGTPATPDDIPTGEVLCFSTTADCPGWTLYHGDEKRHIQAAPRLISDDMVTLRTSAIAGGGITCLPAYMMRNALNAGQLVRVLPDWSPQTSTISLLTPPKAQSSRLAGAFSDFLAAEMPRIMKI
jgi:DNA-binding transcriptional LysR family regulator